MAETKRTNIGDTRQKTCEVCGKPMFIGGYLKHYKYKLYDDGHTRYFCSNKCMSEYRAKINHKKYRRLGR